MIYGITLQIHYLDFDEVYYTVLYCNFSVLNCKDVQCTAGLLLCPSFRISTSSGSQCPHCVRFHAYGLIKALKSLCPPVFKDDRSISVLLSVCVHGQHRSLGMHRSSVIVIIL